MVCGPMSVLLMLHSAAADLAAGCCHPPPMQVALSSVFVPFCRYLCLGFLCAHVYVYIGMIKTTAAGVWGVCENLTQGLCSNATLGMPCQIL